MFNMQLCVSKCKKYKKNTLSFSRCLYARTCTLSLLPPRGCAAILPKV